MRVKKSESTYVQSVRIERSVHEQIREAAYRSHRSISQQVNYYLEIGMREAEREEVGMKT